MIDPPNSMCELLGINFEEPVLAHVTMRQFAMRDVENADGWGLGWYRGRSLAIAKEPLTWRQSSYADFLADYPNLESTIYLGHVRNKTVGGNTKRADTHPFSRELFGLEFCFTHNGTVRRAMEELPLGRFTPIGETDSEHVFCHLLDDMARRDIRLEHKDEWRWLHETLKSINTYGKFNCMLSDGRRLFCYHDVNGFKGLCRCERPLMRAEHESLDDPTFHVELEAEETGPGVIAATRPIDDGEWRCFDPGELAVIERGRVVHSTHPAGEPVRYATRA